MEISFSKVPAALEFFLNLLLRAFHMFYTFLKQYFQFWISTRSFNRSNLEYPRNEEKVPASPPIRGIRRNTIHDEVTQRHWEINHRVKLREKKGTKKAAKMLSSKARRKISTPIEEYSTMWFPLKRCSMSCKTSHSTRNRRVGKTRGKKDI